MSSAYIIANVRVADATQYEEYKKLSSLAMRAFGAEVCVRGGVVEVLEGDWQPDRVVFTSKKVNVGYYPTSHSVCSRPLCTWRMITALPTSTRLWNQLC